MYHTILADPPWDQPLTEGNRYKHHKYKEYHTILADPPWDQPMRTGGLVCRSKPLPSGLPYPTMTVEQIAALPVGRLAATGCHLWLWTTNAFLEAGFQVMRAWGFKYLAPIVWIKPSGIGNYFVHRTQTILFGYHKRCYFRRARYLPNLIEAPARRHSEKPPESYELIEAVSRPRRLELFARAQRPGWDVWGNEITPNPTVDTILTRKDT